MNIAEQQAAQLMAAAELERRKRQRLQRRSVYRADIPAFARDVLGFTPAPYQEDIFGALLEHRRVAVRSLHGVGKTALMACVALWAVTMLDDDTKVVITASAWRQLTKFLFPEIRKWAASAKWGQVGITMRWGKELLDLSIKLPGREAFAAASDNPALLEGAHGKHLVYLFDESKSIPDATWDAAEGAFSTGDCYALAVSTPGEPSGRFYDIHARRPGFDDWWTRHVRLEEAIAAGRINPDWVEQRRVQWGENSAVFQNRVLGNFATSGEDSVIPLAWIEQANQRWAEAEGRGQGALTLGVDPARYGEDRTAIASLRGNVIERVQSFAQADTMQTAGYTIMALGGERTARIGIDVIGIGAGVFDRLKEQGFSVVAVNAGAGTDAKDASGTLQFLNVRAAMWWALRERLDPAGRDLLALPPDDRLTGDLAAPRWTVTSSGKIKIESKDEVRARIGRSTDFADAVGAALWAAAAKSRTITASVGRWA